MQKFDEFDLDLLFQSVLTVSQTYWCLALTRILSTEEDRQKNLQEFEQKSYQDLNKLAALVRQELPQVRHVRHASALSLIFRSFSARS